MSAAEQEFLAWRVNPEPLPYSVTEPPVVAEDGRIVDDVPNGTGEIALFEHGNANRWIQSDHYLSESEMR